MLSSGFINGSNIKYLVLILRSILLEDTKLWERNNVAIESILEHTITFYKNSRLLESTKLDIFAILVDVSENNLVKRCVLNYFYKIYVILSIIFNH